MKTAQEFLRDVLGSEPANFLTYADALKAVQAAIDHYDPLPGKLELVYRVPDAPRPNVFPPACPRCLQRGADCLCEQAPF
jgi:hypothetical protein